MNVRFKNRENRKERQFYYLKLALFSFFFSLFSICINAQDSIPAKEDLTEEAELKFQQFFFKALSEKSIGNYQKAIENLESCNQLLTNDVAVFFEFSKNYLLLNNTLIAKEYINRALEKDADNIWMLKHLVKVYQKENTLSVCLISHWLLYSPSWCQGVIPKIVFRVHQAKYLHQERCLSFLWHHHLIGNQLVCCYLRWRLIRFLCGKH